jgi:hypothetical protein
VLPRIQGDARSRVPEKNIEVAALVAEAKVQQDDNIVRAENELKKTEKSAVEASKGLDALKAAVLLMNLHESSAEGAGR